MIWHRTPVYVPKSDSLNRLCQFFVIILAWYLSVAAAAAAVIAIDIGHSKASEGSVSAAGYGEFQYNRALAIDVARLLRANGHQVDLYNEHGSIRSLAARPARASAIGADLFISIHHDSIQQALMPRREHFRGYSVWTSGSHKNASASVACGSLIASTMKRAGMTPALFHAEKIPGEGHTLINPVTGHYRRDGLAVLRHSKTPAVLIEAGVIVNPREEAWLNRPAVRLSIARTIAAGINACITSPRGR